MKDTFLIITTTLTLLFAGLWAVHVFLDVSLSLQNKSFYDDLSAVAKDSYRHLSAEDVETLLEETWLPGWRYEEFTGFSEEPRTGEFVNVAEHGYRGKRSAENADVWFFGGSTTFGYGVSDWETIPASLANITQWHVVNYGRGFYYSEQENALFQKLLVSGEKPKIAVFLDGMNERCEISAYQKSMSRLFKKASARYHWGFEELFYPLYVLKSKVINELSDLVDRDIGEVFPDACSRYGKTYSLGTAFSRNLRIREALCEGYGVSCYTFLQPFAGVDAVHEDFSELSEWNRSEAEKKKNAILQVVPDANVIDISDALSQFTAHCFVDDVHYNQEASFAIAENIARHLGKSTDERDAID